MLGINLIEGQHDLLRGAGDFFVGVVGLVDPWHAYNCCYSSIYVDAKAMVVPIVHRLVLPENVDDVWESVEQDYEASLRSWPTIIGYPINTVGPYWRDHKAFRIWDVFPVRAYTAAEFVEGANDAYNQTGMAAIDEHVYSLYGEKEGAEKEEPETPEHWGQMNAQEQVDWMEQAVEKRQLALDQEAGQAMRALSQQRWNQGMDLSPDSRAEWRKLLARSQRAWNIVAMVYEHDALISNAPPPFDHHESELNPWF